MSKLVQIKILLSVFLMAAVMASPAAAAGLNTGAGPWQWVEPPVQGATIFAVDFLDSKPNTGWGAGLGGMVLKTTDGGASWATMPTDTNVNLFDVDFTSANNGWATGNDIYAGSVVLRTTDGGNTWTSQTLGSQSISLQAISFNGNNGAVVGAGKAFYTTNGGSSWVASTGINGLHFLNSVQMVTTLVGYAGGSGGAIYKTTNGGESWSQQTSNTTSEITSLNFVDSSKGFAVASYDSHTAGRLLRTIDGGTTWTASTDGLIGVSLWGVDLTGSGNNTLVAVGKGGAILKRANADTWSSGTVINDIASGLNSGTPSSGTTSDLYDVDFPAVQAGPNYTGYASGAAGVITKTADTAANWTMQAGGNAVNLRDSSFIDANTGWLVGDYGTVIYTDDRGETWETRETDIPANAHLQGVHFLDASNGFSVGCQGTPSGGDPVADEPREACISGSAVAYKTTNGGASWTPMTGLGGINNLKSVHMTDSSNGWAVGSNGVAVRTSNGTSWAADATGISIDHDLTAVDSIVAGTNAWAVGWDSVAKAGRIYKYAAGAWTPITPASAPSFLTGVDMIDADTGYVTGSSGKMYKTTAGGDDAGEWTPLTSGTSRLLADVSCSDASNCFAAGDQGRLIHTRDGGVIWSAESMGTNVPMLTVSTNGERQAFVAGANGSVLRALRPYYFTWYDDLYSDNWVIMANPSGAADNLAFELFIDGVQRDLSGNNGGIVGPGQSIYPKYNGVIGGPVNAASLTSAKGMVSQRILWPKGGSSLEEVLGQDIETLSDHYYWTWYDQVSPGFTNYVLVANPNPYTIYYEIKVAGVVVGSGTIAMGQNVTPTFPTKQGGPVEVQAWTTDAKSAPAFVLASQRVLSNNGTALNEAVGIPADQLSDDYYWPWYDNVYGSNWILVANPNGASVNYKIEVGDGGCNPSPPANTACDQGTLPGAGSAPNNIIYRRFDNVINGPVRVTSTGGNVIASQRVVFGPSFGETAGYPAANLTDTYHWAWYDQGSAGMKNWVMIANPADASGSVTYNIKIAGQPAPAPGGSGTLAPGQRAYPSFPDINNGPVEVTASGPVIASQRVLYNGYFNETLGTDLS